MSHVSVDSPVGTGSLTLTRLGAIPATGTNNADGGAEVVTFDRATGQLFTLNARDGRIDVTRIGADGSLTSVGGIALTDDVIDLLVDVSSTASWMRCGADKSSNSGLYDHGSTFG